MSLLHQYIFEIPLKQHVEIYSFIINSISENERDSKVKYNIQFLEVNKK